MRMQTRSIKARALSLVLAVLLVIPSSMFSPTSAAEEGIQLELSTAEILAAIEQNGGDAAPLYNGGESGGNSPALRAEVYSVDSVPTVTVVDEEGAVLDSYAAPALGRFASYTLDEQAEAFVQGLDLSFAEDAAHTLRASIAQALDGQIFVKDYTADGNQAVVVIDPASYELTLLAVNPSSNARYYTLTITDAQGDAVALSMVSSIARSAALEELSEAQLAQYRGAGVEVEILAVTETVAEVEPEVVELEETPIPTAPQPRPAQPEEEEQLAEEGGGSR